MPTMSHWMWLVIGVVLGWFVVPKVISAVHA